MVSIGIVEITERGRPEPVAEDLRMALQELLRKAELDGDVDFLRDGVRVLAQELMEIEVAQHVGAEKYERGIERTGEHPLAPDLEVDVHVQHLSPAFHAIDHVDLHWTEPSEPAPEA